MQDSLHAHACLSLYGSGSMRFRWDEKNHNRDIFFTNHFSDKKVVPLELIHSKTVLTVDEGNETVGLRADGLITCNPSLIPVLTVADCMPIYLWEKDSGCFGVLHSGWKGTGIVTEALNLAKEKYGAQSNNFHVVIGPHIKSCCYLVDEQRAQYFAEEFTPDCVELIDETSKKYRLSLEKANLFLLEKAGIKRENVSIVGGCTCCTITAGGSPIYGSFRRETAHFPPNSDIKEMQKHFTPMAAFMCIGENALQNNETALVHTIK